MEAVFLNGAASSWGKGRVAATATMTTLTHALGSAPFHLTSLPPPPPLLPPLQTGDKVLKTARLEVYGSSSAAEDGKWSIDRVLELHKVRVGVGRGGLRERVGFGYWRSCEDNQSWVGCTCAPGTLLYTYTN